MKEYEYIHKALYIYISKPSLLCTVFIAWNCELAECTKGAVFLILNMQCSYLNKLLKHDNHD